MDYKSFADKYRERAPISVTAEFIKQTKKRTNWPRQIGKFAGKVKELVVEGDLYDLKGDYSFILDNTRVPTIFTLEHAILKSSQPLGWDMRWKRSAEKHSDLFLDSRIVNMRTLVKHL